MTISFTDSDGMVNHLINDIDEKDFTEAVEIIGWMYQYYISEYHEEVVNAIRGKAIKKKIFLLQHRYLRQIGLFVIWLIIH